MHAALTYAALKHHVLKLAIAILLIAFTSPLHAGTVVMDQHAVPIPREDGGGQIGAGGPDFGIGAAQSFTVGVAGNLDRISAPMGSINRSSGYAWPLVVELHPFLGSFSTLGEPLARRTWDDAQNTENLGILTQEDFLVPSIPVEVGDQFVIVAFGGDPVLKDGRISWLTQGEVPIGARANFYEGGNIWEVENGVLLRGDPSFDYAFTTFVEVPEPGTLLLGVLGAGCLLLIHRWRG